MDFSTCWLICANKLYTISHPCRKIGVILKFKISAPIIYWCLRFCYRTFFFSFTSNWTYFCRWNISSICECILFSNLNLLSYYIYWNFFFAGRLMDNCIPSWHRGLKEFFFISYKILRQFLIQLDLPCSHDLIVSVLGFNIFP